MRSRCRCSMCSAIHINSRSWLRSSSTHEPSDPPLKVVSFPFSYQLPRGVRGRRTGKNYQFSEFFLECGVPCPLTPNKDKGRGGIGNPGGREGGRRRARLFEPRGGRSSRPRGPPPHTHTQEQERACEGGTRDTGTRYPSETRDASGAVVGPSPSLAPFLPSSLESRGRAR